MRFWKLGIGMFSGAPTVMKLSLNNKWIAAGLTGLLSLIAITPLCGFLFQCGCDWPGLGLDAACNFHEPQAEHKCPWCASSITGVLATALSAMFGVLAASIVPIRRTPRFVNEMVVRTSLGLSTFVISALLAAIIAAAWQGYPFGVGMYAN